MHENGFRIFGTSREPGKYQEKVPFVMLQLDITDKNSINSCINELIKQAPSLDVLINNAGAMLSGIAEETSIEQGRNQFETNFCGTIELTQALLPHFRRQKSGRIITIGSVLGLIGMPSVSFYSATKHALEGFFKSLRFELKQFNVEVSMVEPSFFKSNISKNATRSTERINDYDKFRAKVVEFASLSMQKAPEPHPIADKVLEIINTDKPNFNYPVGKSSRLLPALQYFSYNKFENALLKKAKLSEL